MMLSGIVKLTSLTSLYLSGNPEVVSTVCACAVPSTDQGMRRIFLRAYYAISSTETSYGATRATDSAPQSASQYASATGISYAICLRALL
eukprot:2165618-Rhodomonas_salina.1